MAETIYPSPGCCIYCGAIDGLTDEHVVAFGLNGAWVIENASCETCRGITAKFEDGVLRIMLKPFRVQRDMKTRDKKGFRDARMKVEVARHGLEFGEQLHPTAAPSTLVLPAFGIPGILLGFAPRLDDTVFLTDWVASDSSEWLRTHGYVQAKVSGVMYVGKFMRMSCCRFG